MEWPLGPLVKPAGRLGRRLDEEWLLANENHPGAGPLRGHHDVMGFAYLTLGVPRS